MKKNILKRLLSLALALVLVAGLLPNLATEVQAASVSHTYSGVTLNAQYAQCPSCMGTNTQCYLGTTGGWIKITGLRTGTYEYGTWKGEKVLYIDYSFYGHCVTCSSKQTGSGTIMVRQNAVCGKTISSSVQNVDGCAIGGYRTVTTPGHVISSWTGNGTSHSGNCLIHGTVSENCSGGTANCTQRAVCSTCNSAYGSTNDKHSWGGWVSNGNNTHTRTCNNNSAHKETQNCSGGTATCNTPATCSTCKQTYGTKLGHTLTYAVKSGTTNVLVETCFRCTHSAEATLTATDDVYTGKEIKTANVIYGNGWSGGQPAISYNYSNNINAGTATVSAAVKGVTLTKQFAILPAELEVSALKQYNSLTYNGQAQQAQTTYSAQSVNGQSAKASYSLTQEGPYGEMPLFTDAGSYPVYYKVSANNHKDVMGTVVITINPKNLAGATVVLPEATYTYDGNEHKPRPTVTLNGFDGLVEGTDYDVTYANNVNSGTATVTITGKKNFTGTASATFFIDKATASVTTAPTANDLVYNGEAQDLVTAGSANIGKLQYSTDNVNWSHEIPQATNVGTYTVYYKIVEGSNYTGTEVASVDVTISKRPVTVKATDASKTYGDTDPELTWTVTSGTELAGEKLTLIISRAAGEDAGTYAIAVGQPEGANENYDITFVNGTFTINKAALTVTANAVSKTYGEADPELTYKVEGLVNGDELTGQLERVAGENVGTYAIALGTLTAGDNYTITYTGADFTISKRDVTVTAKDQTITYGDAISNTEITSDGLVDGHSITVTLTPSTANVTVDGTITAGAAVITADGTDVTANYEIAYGEPSVLVIQPDTSKIDTLTTENVTSANEADIQAVREMLENADSTKEEWEAISEKCEALIEKIEEVEAQMKEATDEAAAFDAETVNSTDTEELEQLAEDIEALLDSDNLTEDERAALEEVLEQVSGMIDTIENTAEDSKAAIDTIDALDPETVTSADKDELEQAVETIDELLAEDHLTEEERKALEDAKADAEALITVIGSAQAATDTENTEKVEDVTAENVVPEDKADLEEAKADLEKALEDNGINYTEEEKNGIQEEIDRLDAAIEALENVEAVTESITQLPEAVEPDDEETAQKILDAKKAYDALTDHEKSLVNETAKEKLGELVTALTAYDIIKGDGSTWTKDSASTITFTANGPFSKFVGIKVDGKDVDNADYEAKSGSTIITLNQKFLKKLSTGKHTITVIYTDGEASGTFLIRAEAGTPATGDNFNILLWTSVMIVNLAAISVLLINQKKRRYVK